jgi:predicted metal-binding membrane protein
MLDSATRSLLLQRNLILGLLLAIAAACWGVLIWQQSGMTMSTPTMGVRAPLFLAIWVIMMVAMMFPTSAPMILTYHRIQAGKRARNEAWVSTWMFVGAYMLVWSLSGALAYAGAVAAEAIAARTALSAATAARIGGLLLVLAGAYQLSPLKNVCLAKCRSPLSFILTSWRDGRLGALRMGLSHGFFCLGCCWLLFLALFPLGIMNIAAMIAVTVLVFAEKTLAAGERIAKWTGIGLMLYGLLVLFVPQALPTFMSPGAMGGMHMG